MHHSYRFLIFFCSISCLVVDSDRNFQNQFPSYTPSFQPETPYSCLYTLLRYFFPDDGKFDQNNNQSASTYSQQEKPPEILELDVVDSGTGQVLLQSTLRTNDWSTTCTSRKKIYKIGER
ncbi:hypothetical protein OUZ56_006823 [Daphnia magna]|uniref:Secreted protein n=1 Tax=Daphnia magna TaxID=35525 RepID=A0ABQ9YWS5_9CRUS|nr:hypothetical protein OUZ56_006823 [Daphnia magna]